MSCDSVYSVRAVFRAYGRVLWLRLPVVQCRVISLYGLGVLLCSYTPLLLHRVL